MGIFLFAPLTIAFGQVVPAPKLRVTPSDIEYVSACFEGVGTEGNRSARERMRDCVQECSQIKVKLEEIARAIALTANSNRRSICQNLNLPIEPESNELREISNIGFEVLRCDLDQLNADQCHLKAIELQQALISQKLTTRHLQEVVNQKFITENGEWFFRCKYIDPIFPAIFRGQAELLMGEVQSPHCSSR
jgi:hypothetical protein